MISRGNRGFLAPLAELAEQIKALRASCAEFDKGELWEAKRIAATLYILLCDGKRKTTAVMSQLGMRDKRKYFTTQHHDPALRPGYMPFVAFVVNTQRATCVALREEALNMPWARFVTFDEWWREPIYVSKAGVPLSREQLVRAIRDQDGGGHFDANLTDEAYAELKRYDVAKAHEEIQPGVYDAIEQPQRDIIRRGVRNAPQAAIRQIAWEFLYSIDNFQATEEAA